MHAILHDLFSALNINGKTMCFLHVNFAGNGTQDFHDIKKVYVTWIKKVFDVNKKGCLINQPI